MHWQTKTFVWLTLLWYLPYYSGLELDPQYLCSMPVLWICFNFTIAYDEHKQQAITGARLREQQNEELKKFSSQNATVKLEKNVQQPFLATEN